MARAAAVTVAIMLTSCGGTSDNAAEPEAVATTPAKVTSRAWTCDGPSGQEKGSLRFRVRAHDRELRDEPWALVRRGGINFMAAEIDAAEVSAPLVVLVSFPAKGTYVAGMEAVNATARTFTDLPHGGDTIPKGGTDALFCMTD